jgi:LPS-assembly protein
MKMDILKISQQLSRKQAKTIPIKIDSDDNSGSNSGNSPDYRFKHEQLSHTRRLTFSLLLSVPWFFLAQSTMADVYQSNGWQCQPLPDNKWNCAVSEGPLAPQLGSVDGRTEIPLPAASVVAVKPAFPEPDFSDPNTFPTGGSAVIQPRLKSHSAAQTRTWASCAVQPLEEYDRSSMAAQADDSTNIEADNAQSPDSEQIDFDGNVVITKGIQQLTSDKASYNKASGMFTADGNVIITEPNREFRGDTARYQSDERKGRLDNATYSLPARPAQGVADNIRFKPGTIDLDNPTYSTCPVGDQDWVLSASEMELHTDEGYGEAKHAVMRFKGVPIAYTPYISFPLNDDRKSGFLMPSIGYSDTNGAEIETPYYFNIAPDQDATVTPKIFSDRGLMLGGEYRYLSENHSGEVYGEWLNDSSYDDRRDASDVASREFTTAAQVEDTDVDGKIKPRDISKNRGAFSLQQRANWSNGWSGNVDYNYVTDNYYIEDFWQ